MDYEPSPGDFVRIGEGAFAGLEALVLAILPARARVRVLMEFLGREIEAEVDRVSILGRVAQIASEEKIVEPSGQWVSASCL